VRRGEVTERRGGRMCHKPGQGKCESTGCRCLSEKVPRRRAEVENARQNSVRDLFGAEKKIGVFPSGARSQAIVKDMSGEIGNDEGGGGRGREAKKIREKITQPRGPHDDPPFFSDSEFFTDGGTGCLRKGRRGARGSAPTSSQPQRDQKVQKVKGGGRSPLLSKKNITNNPFSSGGMRGSIIMWGEVANQVQVLRDTRWRRGRKKTRGGKRGGREG